eukprot:COSAG04_NODE_11561_length_702_cov_0.766169_2_plen_178_part_00
MRPYQTMSAGRGRRQAWHGRRSVGNGKPKQLCWGTGTRTLTQAGGPPRRTRLLAELRARRGDGGVAQVPRAAGQAEHDGPEQQHLPRAVVEPLQRREELAEEEDHAPVHLRPPTSRSLLPRRRKLNRLETAWGYGARCWSRRPSRRRPALAAQCSWPRSRGSRSSGRGSRHSRARRP